MKKRIKVLVYNTLIKWGWIEKQEPVFKKDIGICQFQELVKAYNFDIVYSFSPKVVNVYDNLNRNSLVASIPYAENPYLTALAYFAYYGIREKKGEGMKATIKE